MRPWRSSTKEVGSACDISELLRHHFRGDHDAIVDLVRGDVRAHGLPAVIVHRQAQDGKALILIFLFEFDEPGYFDFARSAPSGPKIHQHYFAAIIRKVDGIAVSILQCEVRRLLTLAFGFEFARCANSSARKRTSADETAATWIRLITPLKYHARFSGRRGTTGGGGGARGLASVNSSCLRSPANSHAAVSQKLSQA